MRRALLAILAAAAVTLSLLVAGVPAPATAGTTGGAGPAAGQGDPGGLQPEGVNDWDCRPTKRRPVPAITVHGTFGDSTSLLGNLQQALLDAGFCVFSLNYGERGTQRIQASARVLKKYVARVLRATGAEQVSMVGHSQGGMMPRYYLKFLGGTSFVDDLVGLSPSNHGTAITEGGQNPLSLLIDGPCRACVQQGTGSRFLTRLNAGDETPGRVSYTQVTTVTDEVVIPHTSGYLAPGPRTQNVTLQDVCPLAVSDHLLIPMNPTAISIAVKALTHDGPWRPRYGLTC